MDAETIHTLDTTNTSELTMNTDATIPRSTCCWPTLQSPAQPVARGYWLQGFVGGRLGALWVARCIVGAWVGAVKNRWWESVALHFTSKHERKPALVQQGA